MSLKRFFAIADNTITDAFKTDGQTRATGSNTGDADVLEVFANYGEVEEGKMELSRILIQFDIDEIKKYKDNGSIPDDAKWILRMYNVEHGLTVPKNFRIYSHEVDFPWEEGYGVDLDTHGDDAKNFGSSWSNKKPGTDNEWATSGGDFTPHNAFQDFETGLEDLEIDVTTIIQGHIDDPAEHHGFLIKLSDTEEDGTVSYYTKRFFARSTEFYYKRPVLEARWGAPIKDDRGCFYASSSLAPADDNLNTLYLYNRIRGALKDIPAVGQNNFDVSLYESIGGTPIAGSPFTGTYVSDGIYKCQVHADTDLETIYDVWSYNGTAYHTGSIEVKKFEDDEEYQSYVLKVSNPRSYYSNIGTERFRLYIRPKNWSPSIYTVAKSKPETTIVRSASVEVTRTIDGEKIISHATGSGELHTMMSYDINGNYFDLDMTIFEPGYDYSMGFSFYNDNVKAWQDQGYKFRFKVREDE